MYTIHKTLTSLNSFVYIVEQTYKVRLYQHLDHCTVDNATNDDNLSQELAAPVS